MKADIRSAIAQLPPGTEAPLQTFTARINREVEEQRVQSYENPGNYKESIEVSMHGRERERERSAEINLKSDVRKERKRERARVKLR